MPTVIIVDNSLSMGRLVGKKEKEYKPTTPKSPQETITIDGWLLIYIEFAVINTFYICR